MNKNFKVITVNGTRGIIMAVFIILGLVAGFIISPGWVCMKLWNIFIADHFSVMPMKLYQGLLLWAIIALSLYLMNNKKALIGFGSYSKLTPEQIKDIMNRAKTSNGQILGDFEMFETIQKELKSAIDNNVETKNEKDNSEKEEEIKG